VDKLKYQGELPMSAITQESWSEALPIMEDIFTEVTYGTYIERLRPLYIKDNIFYLYIESNFHKVTIEQKYLKDVTKALRIVMDTDIDVKLVSDDNIDKNGNIVDHEPPKIRTKIKTNLVPKYLFETFVEGTSNQLAYATALAVSESPGQTTYNPLFLYGGVGLGKTHLMHSIGNRVLQRDPESLVLYCSAEEFMNELITSIRTGKNQAFRDKYRDIDVLLIDDIQFLSDKEGTQEEFFHTFNSLYNSGKQLVISSDQPPKELKTLEDRLRSRIGWGVVVDVTLPNFETRNAILKRKADQIGIDVSDEITEFIAMSVVSNIRDLESALNKVCAYSSLSRKEISLDLAKEALKDIIDPVEKHEITVEYIQKIVSNYFNLQEDDIRSKKRSQNIVYPRQVAMYLCRKLLSISLPKIGEGFGGRDHSTVIHSCDKIAELIESDSQIRAAVIEIEKLISS